MNDIRYGLLLPGGVAQLERGGAARSLAELAVTAEGMGFDSVWLGDSLSRARIEPLTILAAAAALTERITLGTAALMPAYRHPVQAAATLASLDQLASGRLILGVGAGFPELSRAEFDLVGVDYRTRFSQLDDTVDLWRRLWSENTDPFHGKVLHYDWLPDVPQPHRPGGPPIWATGITPAALARTGRRYDGWLPYPPDVDTYVDGLTAVRAAATAAGRAESSITPALFATVYLSDDPGEGRAALDRYAQATYRMPVETVETIQVLMTGTTEHVAAQLDRYIAAGAEHILLRIAALDPSEFAGQLALMKPLLRPLTISR
ncbi:LLM class flavin-dependent oxidoreductase [Nocardia africana]|uniref:F420-dependent glucose-6-phosphate dehydrogenase n=1 Tax=Nocardia africana TaxID=134964 RepID=A0A378WRA5_9NOCA|nr:LLM class flavin-dependent oxidoreductase [Nocardia africana]MCC3314462.1 LLM class flavin-dependent oxidoreductase [Nocardia africana]SUA43267.1 F420-dependent glucose-6-phosphate dehydrogenase [Nocardia africana]